MPGPDLDHSSTLSVLVLPLPAAQVLGSGQEES